MITTVIFDMDGTMIDSEPVQAEAYAVILREYGKVPIPFRNGLIQPQGMKGDETWTVVKEKYDIDEDTNVLRAKRRRVYEKLLQEKVKTMPGLYTLLGHLKKKKIVMAIASSSPKKQIEFVIEKFGLGNYFSGFIGGEDVVNGKPHPEPFLKASALLGTHPKHTLVIEDAPNGIIAAKKAGMIVVALLTKYSTGSDYSLADITCTSLTEIIRKVQF